MLYPSSLSRFFRLAIQAKHFLRANGSKLEIGIERASRSTRAVKLNHNSYSQAQAHAKAHSLQSKRAISKESRRGINRQAEHQGVTQGRLHVKKAFNVI